MTDIGKAFRDARIFRDMSQNDLAAAAGMQRTFISKVENGATTPTLETIFRISEALQIEPWKLVRQAYRYRVESREERLRVFSLNEGASA